MIKYSWKKDGIVLSTHKLRGYLAFPSNFIVPITSDIQTLIQSIKYRLITKLNAQIETNLRNESIKPNQSMI